ncbi:MAG: ABC transporter permease subunit, partial [Clostridiales bacterium]|nr:ABC transporter permease subunit [Clostridiales bacterium]
MDKENRAARIRLCVALCLTLVFCAFCLIAPQIMPNDPNHADLLKAKLSPCRQYPFGTDWLGRCVFSRVLDGAASTVFSALLVVLITMVIGCAAGIVCGYYGGVLDTVIMRTVDIFLAFPGMVLALAVAGMLGPGMKNAIIALSATGWTQYARLTRSYVLSLRQENFIYAARLNGQRPANILFRHVLPNAVRPVIVTASLSIGSTMLGLAGLSFLGLGSRAPEAEWGSMLSDGRGLMQQAPWIVLYPGLAIFVASVLFNFLGDCVRDVLDPLDSQHIFTRKERKKKMKRKLALFLAAFMPLGTLSACGQKKPEESPGASADAAKENAAPADFVCGVYNFSKIDPADGYNGWGTMRYGVGETLFKLDDNLKVVPLLATAYKLSDDKLTWTIKLRDGVLFHNGDAMDGAAVKASLERLVAKNERAASDLKIASIEAKGNTVSITTTEPNPTLVNALCDPYACIVDADADNGETDFEMYPVCTGPYVVKEYTPDVSAYLEPFADYWGGTPKCKSVTVKAIPDVDTLSLAMQNGEIDAAYGLSYDTLPLFSNSDKYKVTQAATTRVYML